MPRRLGARRCTQKHHRATTSLWLLLERLEQVPGVVTKPQKEPLPESQPRLQWRAAALARGGACSRTCNAGTEGSSQGCRAGVLCCQNSSCDEGGELCVWGRSSGTKLFGQYLPHQTRQWVSPKEMVWHPGEGKEEL